MPDGRRQVPQGLPRSLHCWSTALVKRWHAIRNRLAENSQVASVQRGFRCRHCPRSLSAGPRASQDGFLHLVLCDAGKFTKVGECLAEFTDLNGLGFIISEFACSLYDRSQLLKFLESYMRTLGQVDMLSSTEN